MQSTNKRHSGIYIVKNVFHLICQAICGENERLTSRENLQPSSESVVKFFSSLVLLIKYGKWKRENTKEARMEYNKSRQNAKRVISSAKEKKQKECANDLNDCECQNEIFRMAKQMVKER